MNPHAPKSETPLAWRDRLRALSNLPPLLKMVWDTSPWLVSSSLVLRLVSSVLPLAQLWVGKLIIDQVVRRIAHRPTDPQQVWNTWQSRSGLPSLAISSPEQSCSAIA
jgi:ATP-binding cassette subfamily B protein